MEIIEVGINKLVPYDKNPRKNSQAVKYVANSIREFGFKVPIIIDAKNVIIAGHTRYLAAKQLKMPSVPCILADDLTPEEVRAFRLADNKSAEFSEWDFSLLDAELASLNDLFDMSNFGFSSLEEDDIVSENLSDDSTSVGVTKSENVLKFCNKTVYMTEEEAEAMLKRLDQYVKEEGVTFGFVSALLNL